MTITVNDIPLDYKVEAEATMGELLGAVEEYCNKNGHSIFKVLVDGTEIPADHLDELFQRAITDNLCLALYTISAERIKSDISNIGEKLLLDSEQLHEVPVKIQTGDDAFVYNIMERISKNIKLLFECLGLHRISNIGFETKIGEETVLEYQKKISAFLKDITDALETKDIVTVSDIAEYELSPQLESFGKGLISLVG